jgi:hypothetical protein
MLHVRQLGARDLGAIERHLLELEPADRRARFLYYASDSVIAAYARGIDPSQTVLIGAFDPFGDSDCLIGLAEAHPAEALHMVEIAVTVDAYFRRRGLARRLVALALAIAFAGGARSAQFFFAPSNDALMGLVNSLGGWITAPGYAEFFPSADGLARTAA